MWSRSFRGKKSLNSLTPCPCKFECGYGLSGINGTPKSIPEVFSEVEVRTAGTPCHPLHFQILQEVSDKPCCVHTSVVIMTDKILLTDCWASGSQMVAKSYVKDVNLNNDKSCFSSEIVWPEPTVILFWATFDIWLAEEAVIGQALWCPALTSQTQSLFICIAPFVQPKYCETMWGVSNSRPSRASVQYVFQLTFNRWSLIG